MVFFFFFQAEDGIRDADVTGVQTCALPISAHAIGVANGTDALTLTLRALAIGAGDEVVVPANTFIATAEAVVLAGATPRFADVDPDTLLLTADGLAAAI